MASLSGYSFNPYGLVPLLCAAVNFGVLLVIVRQRYQNGTLRWLSVVLLCACLWAAAQVPLRMSDTAADALSWHFAEMMGYMFIGPSVLGFCLSYVGKRQILSRFWAYVLLYGPAVVLAFLGLTTNLFYSKDVSTLSRESHYGQWSSPAGPAYIYFFSPWLALMILMALILLWRFARRQRQSRRVKQAWILFIALSISTVGGIVTEVVPVLLREPVINMATLFMTATGALFAYGMVRYRLFEVNPGALADNVLQAMHEMVLVVAPDFAIESTNAAVERLLGFRLGDVLGRSVWELVDEAERLRPSIEAKLKGNQEVVNVEMGVRGKSATVLPVGLSVTAYRDENNDVLAYVWLLTDLRHVRELLQVEGERDKLRATLSSMTDAVVGLDEKRRIVLANQAALHLFDWVEKQTIGTSLDEQLHFSVEGAFLAVDQLWSGQEKDKALRRVKRQVSVLTLSGKRLVMDVVAAQLPERDEGGGLRVILTLHDVTEEQALAQMKLNFTMLASHELRTPLTALRGYLSTLRDKRWAKADDEEREMLSRLDGGTERLFHLTEELLLVSHIEQGSLMVKKEPVVVQDLLREAVRRFEGQADRRKVALVLEQPAGGLKVRADSQRLSEAISVLVENALEHSAAGKRVSVGVADRDGWAEVFVEDEGEGIEQRDQQRLFTEFSRVDATLETSRPGMGLGLYLVKWIVEQHGGTVGVESEPGHGARFYFRLLVVD